MFYLYVLRSRKDSELYFGFTSDLKKRFTEHNSGKVPSTKWRLPLELVYYEAYLSKDDALGREHQLKYYGKAWSELKKRLKASIDNAPKVRG